jgi:hypothetical protein
MAAGWRSLGSPAAYDVDRFDKLTGIDPLEIAQRDPEIGMLDMLEPSPDDREHEPALRQPGKRARSRWRTKGFQRFRTVSRVDAMRRSKASRTVTTVAKVLPVHGTGDL